MEFVVNIGGVEHAVLGHQIGLVLGLDHDEDNPIVLLAPVSCIEHHFVISELLDVDLNRRNIGIKINDAPVFEIGVLFTAIPFANIMDYKVNSLDHQITDDRSDDHG